VNKIRSRKYSSNFKHGIPTRIHGLVLVFVLGLWRCAHATPIHFSTDGAGYVSLNLYRADGMLVRQVLAGKHLAAGEHEANLGPLANVEALPPGEYTWRAVIHDGLALRLRGWVGDWGGDTGIPCATAADDTQIYLGWSLASATADTVVACDPAGRVRWTHHRGTLSGCRALGVDAGAVFVLGGENGDAEGGALYRLNPKDGSTIPWPDGRIDLKITSLWPAGHENDPSKADYFAVRNGRIYLSFTAGNFISVLDAKTGAYLQTIVGDPSGPIDSTGTKCDTPEKPGLLVDADFLVVALDSGSLGKLLLVHDPLWVVASDITPLNKNERITALDMIGDGAKHHKDDIFAALGPPFQQVQARPALDSGFFSYLAGEAGGRAPRGVWNPNRMSNVRSLALDATGRLWVAEGDPIPKRISVWTTDTAQGRMVREFFAPPGGGFPATVNPIDPGLMIAGGCEWRIDPRTGRAACLGIVTSDAVLAARFAIKNGHVLLVLTRPDGSEVVLKRAGDGDYRPFRGTTPSPFPSKFRMLPSPDGTWQLTTTDGFALGSFFGRTGGKPRSTIPPPPGDDWPHLPEAPGTPTITQALDGRVFLTAGRSRVWNLELTGVDTLRPLASGKITIEPDAH
jgi:hypothetical protein